MPGSPTLRFALPPSLGSAEARERAKGLDEFLSAALRMRVEFSVASDYGKLAQSVCRGECDVAWAPPFACARIETAGLQVLVRGVRDGASTYRAALICRPGSRLTLQTLSGGTAAWVDPDSVGGYLLAAALFKSKGIEYRRTFRQEHFVGSYLAGLDAVIGGQADVTSIFARPGPANAELASTGISEIAPVLLPKLAVLAFTDESPNDGIAAAKHARPEVMTALSKVLLTMNQQPEGLALLKRTFRLDGFEPAPAQGYRVLYRTAVASL